MLGYWLAASYLVAPSLTLVRQRCYGRTASGTLRCSRSSRSIGVTATPRAWAFLRSCLEASPKLLLPGRYYDFRAPTLKALEDKIRNGRAVGARDGATIVALFFQFDNDMPDGPGAGLRRIYTCCAAACLEAAKLGSALLAFGKAQPVAPRKAVGTCGCIFSSLGPSWHFGGCGLM